MLLSIRYNVRKTKRNRKNTIREKKRHTIKSQIIADFDTRQTYDVDGAPGSVHDFKLYKQTALMLCAMMLILVDSGYQGIQHYHANSKMPTKKSKNKPLSETEKETNTDLARQRVFIENINAKIKVFKIMAYPYRNRRKTHLRRTRLICGILNAEQGF